MKNYTAKLQQKTVKPLNSSGIKPINQGKLIEDDPLAEHIPEVIETEQTSAKKRKKRDKKGIITLLCIFLCFVVTIIATNAVTNGYLINELMAITKPNLKATYYCVITNKFDTNEKALNNAKLVRQNGGAGYVFANNTQFYVALCMFSNQNDAKAVAEKNSNTSVLKLDIMKVENSNFDNKMLNSMNDLQQTIIDTNDKMIKIAMSMANGATTDDTATSQILPIRNTILNKKEEIYTDKKLSDDNKRQLLNIIDPYFGGLDSLLISNPNSSSLISDVRYVTCKVGIETAFFHAKSS